MLPKSKQIVRVELNGATIEVERLPNGKFLRPASLRSHEGYATPQLKPAWEPIILARAPRGGKTYAELAMEHGAGMLNVDGGRVSHTDPLKLTTRQPNQGISWNAENTGLRSNPTNIASASPSGRYPANLILDEEAGAMLDEQAGPTSITGVRRNPDRIQQQPGNTPFTRGRNAPEYANDSGGASRFFYCAKASRSEREAGLESIPEVAFGQSNAAKAAIARGEETDHENHLGVNSVKRVRNNHPTVKPLALLRYLATLLLPPDSVQPRRLLVPFAGSGSEMIAGMQAGWDETMGIEQDAHYCAIAAKRLEAAECQVLEQENSAMAGDVQ